MSVPKFIPRTTQLLSHSLAIVFALSTFIPLGQLYYKYDYRCVLNARLEVAVRGNVTPSVYILGDKGSVWGENSLCHFTIFLAVFVAIHAFVWGWFTIHLIRTLKESGRESALYLPIFIMHAILWVCSLVSSALLSSSSSKLCSNLKITPANKYQCSDLATKVWYTDVDTTHPSLSPFSRLTVAQISSWVMTVMVAIPCGVAVFRTFTSAPVAYKVAPDAGTSGVEGPLTKQEYSLAEEDSLGRSLPI